MLGAAETYIALPLLVAASACDVCRRKIPNTITVALLLTGAATSWSTGGVSAAVSALGAAALVFAVLIFVWRARMLGGGDLKLAAGCATWLGMDRLTSFALVAAVAGGMISVACIIASNGRVRREIATNLKLATLRVMPPVTIAQGAGRVSVPYGAGFAFAAAWTLLGG